MRVALNSLTIINNLTYEITVKLITCVVLQQDLSVFSKQQFLSSSTFMLFRVPNSAEKQKIELHSVSTLPKWH